MEAILDITTSEGDFKPAPDLEGCPVSDEEALENIRKSKNIEAPVFVKRKRRADALVYVGAGPSMPSLLEEIKAKKQEGQYIITSNMTNDWLVEHGVVPDAVLVIDPKEKVSNYIKNPQKETEFFIGVVCNEKVGKQLLSQGMKVTKVLIGYGMKNEQDISVQKELYGENNSYLIGGTMTGLRIMNFAIMLGFQTIEIYGVDSCYSPNAPVLIEEGDSRYEQAILSNENVFYADPITGKNWAVLDPPDGGWFYAYKKKHHGPIQIARCPDGRQFWTSPVFAHQAKQFVKWYDRLEGKLKVIVHGDNLTNHLLQCHLNNLECREKKIGVKFWTDKYYPLFKEFFANENHIQYPELAINTIQQGSFALSAALGREVNVMNYDRLAIYGEGKKKIHDVVHTLNLLEHIEIECVDNVLNDLKSLTRYMAIINVHSGETDDLLPNGEQAHITQKNALWWKEKIEHHFDVIEGISRGGENALFICQSLDAKKNKERECSHS